MVVSLVKEMKSYASENNVPIMQDEGIDFLTNFLIKHDIKSVLEVGTAIGYSAILMALAKKDLHITSIERDEVRYLEAVKNVNKFKLDDRITLIYRDAKEVKLSEKYDMIFLDAAKAQNEHFFLQFENNLNKAGFIITDNLNFHGLVDKDDSEFTSSNLRALVRKIRKYVEFLKNNEDYKTEFLTFGDGISISQKKTS